MKPKTKQELRIAIESLPYAKALHVGSDTERQMALDVASVLGKRVVTRKRKNGFAIFAIE